MNKWLQKVERMVVENTAGMTEEQLKWHPEGKWCTADILEHLSLTYRGTRRAFDKVAAAGRPLGGRPALRQRAQIWLVTAVGYFPQGRKSPEVVHPTCTLAGRQALDTVRRELRALMEAQSKLEGDFRHVKIADHPVLGPMTLHQWSRFHYIHARHHMKQIATLRARVATATSRFA